MPVGCTERRQQNTPVLASQLRDCRGFRARDDLHRQPATLADLLSACEAPAGVLSSAAALFVQVLSRGVIAEVRAIQLSRHELADVGGYA